MDTQPLVGRVGGPNLLAAGNLLSEICIEYGPINSLGRFFLDADNAARERGVVLSFGPLDELLRVNLQNRDSWRPLIPIFDCAQGGFRPETGFCILGRNARGKVVAAQAARLYRFDRCNFHEAATTLDLFYADAAAARARGEACRVTAPSARKISGRVVFSGGGWYHPDYRGRDLSCILPRISRAYAHARWNSCATVSMMAEGVIGGGMAQRCGYTNVEWDVTIRNFAIGDLRFALVWMRTDEMLADIEEFSSGARAQHDGVVKQRRAQ
jgi:hypothetical protein